MLQMPSNSRTSSAASKISKLFVVCQTNSTQTRRSTDIYSRRALLYQDVPRGIPDHEIEPWRYQDLWPPERFYLQNFGPVRYSHRFHDEGRSHRLRLYPLQQGPLAQVRPCQCCHQSRTPSCARWSCHCRSCPSRPPSCSKSPRRSMAPHSDGMAGWKRLPAWPGVDCDLDGWTAAHRVGHDGTTPFRNRRPGP